MKEKKVIHNGKEYIFDEKAGKWKTFAENGQVSWALDSLGKTLTGKLDASIAQPNGKTKNVSYLGKTYTVPLSDFDTKNHTVQLKEFDAQFGKGDITETIPTIVKWDEKTKTWTANHNDPYKPTKTEAKTQVDNKAVTGDNPPEGAKTTIPNKGEYVYTGGKWRHKSGDGYDFSANATNEKLLNEKVKNGDYEVWDNKANGYVKGKPVARTAESIKAGGEFRLGLNKKTPLVDNGEGSPDLAEQMPKGGLVPPAAKQIASKKAAGDGITPREQLPTTGITTGSTIKDALGKLGGGGDTPLAKQSELYDPESYLAVKAGKKGLDLGKFGGVTDYLPDVFKAAMGLAGANEKLPEFKTPQYFTDYENKLREQSTQGLTDAEYAQSMRSADRGYAYDVNNISNFAGGRPGVALANLGRAANTLQDAYGNINVADAQMQRQNLQQYGGAVNTHLGLDQNAFNQKFNVAAQNKMAGAQLAADAFANISNRRDFNEAYGKGSAYAKYQESLLQGQEYQNSILDYILKNPSALPEYNPNIMNQNTSIPNYQNYYLPKPTQAPITG